MFSSRRGPVIFLLRVAVFLMVLCALAEVWLRTVTPASEVPIGYQDVQFKIMRFDPTRLTDGVATEGRLGRRGGEWRVNNAGWLSAVDYTPATGRHQPLVALFGDSFIEGFPTDVDQHVDSHLPRLLSAPAHVYAFGHSGWYLEQYVATSRLVSSLYRPDLLVIFIDGGDVTDSVRENRVISPHLWQISGAGGRFAEVAPTAVYVASQRARLARLSAIVNYLRFNATIALPGMRETAMAQPAVSAGAAASSDAWREMVPAADFMVGRLCAEHPGTPIVFVFDGERYLPTDAVSETPLVADALAVQAAGQERPQCYFLDLRLAFSRDWAVHQRRFEASDGYHWNAYGNRLVAETLAQFIDDNHLLQ